MFDGIDCYHQAPEGDSCTGDVHPCDPVTSASSAASQVPAVKKMLRCCLAQQLAVEMLLLDWMGCLGCEMADVS